ncbi:hypothetical protein [uncultured Kordia sp.]|uniref:hypothetical protein n=1 Tax=uncultured Kordia sp. TaxID=507699 RepID=UPI0026281B01|nr:hypothetical protein [uncultured Kordia sp.]
MKKRNLKLGLKKVTITKNLNLITGGGDTLRCPTYIHNGCRPPTAFTYCKQITCAGPVIG